MQRRKAEVLNMEVYYRGFQRGRVPGDGAGIPVKIEKEFSYGGYHWYVPAVYCCPEGVVIDVLRQIPKAKVDAFLEKWEPVAMQYEDREDKMPEEMRLLAEHENPYQFPVRFSVELNGCEGKGLQWSGEGYGGRYRARGLQPVLEEYGYNLNSAWYLCRISCGWPEDGRKEDCSGEENGREGENWSRKLQSLKMQVGTNKAELPCSCHFRTKPGCAPMNVSFIHPSTGEEGTVKVLFCEPETMDWSKHQRCFDRPGEELVYPEHFLRLSYQVSVNGEFRVKDTVRGDSAIRKSDWEAYEGRLAAGEAGDSGCGGPAAVGIIGGISGPVAVCIVGKDKIVREKTAFSSMHFHPVEEAEWILTVQEKLFEPIEVVLI